MKKILTTLIAFSMIGFAAADEDTKLGGYMDDLNAKLKSLRKLEDDDWAGKATAIKEAQDILLTCFPLDPLILEKVEGIDKTKALAEYRKLLALNYAKLCELELALLAEDEDLAYDIQKEIKTLKKEGHQQFIEE